MSLIKTLSAVLVLTSCASIPKMDRPIALYKGCPQVGGICKKTQTTVAAELQATMRDVSPDELSQWVEANIDANTKIMYLETQKPAFAQYTCMHVNDVGVILKYINDLKRKLPGVK